MEHSFTEDAEWFSNQIISRKRLLPTFAHAAALLTERISGDIDQFVDQHAYDKVYEDGELLKCAIPQEYAGRHRLLAASYKESLIFADLLPKMTLVSLVSVFDAYFSRLLKTLFAIKPEILNGSEKQLTFSQLSNFEKIHEAKLYMVDCEIESLLRENHSKQFEWLEKRIKVNLRNDLPSWADFVELTERRNLLVHADGVVNRQYITVCRNAGYKHKEPVSIGDRLLVDPDYYQSACDCIAEIGIKLNQVMWRKLLPSDIEKADTSIITVSYDFLFREHYWLAEVILRFATCPPFKCLSEENALYLKVNLAIALKAQGKDSECMEIVNSIDWSALSDLFKIASYVLTENYNDAAEAMRRIGASSRPTKSEYRDWPLFKWFRKTDQFKSTYEEVFGEQFKIISHSESQEKNRRGDKSSQP